MFTGNNYIFQQIDAQQSLKIDKYMNVWTDTVKTYCIKTSKQKNIGKIFSFRYR